MTPKPIEFEAILIDNAGKGAYIIVPADIITILQIGGRAPVAVTFEGEPYRGSVVTMGDQKILGVKKEIWTKLGKIFGDSIHISIIIDDVPRVAQVPEDLQKALISHPDALKTFQQLSYSHQRQYVDAINDAKTNATRVKRVQLTIDGVLALKDKKTTKNRFGTQRL